MDKRKVIIDCDPGIDDALAIILALKSKEIEVVGITTVSGNVESVQGAKNALKALKLLGRLDIPVYLGESKPVKRELVTAQDTHGEDGLGETFLEEVSSEYIRENGVDFILNTLKNQENVSIIALGPLTNLYRAIEKDSETFHRVKEIVSMGGAYKSHGNCSPVAEFNYWVDPHGAREFLKKFNGEFTMVGLDVTRKIVLTPNLREMIHQFNDEIGDFIYDITRFYVDFHWEQERTLGCVINDPLAVEFFINRDICEGFKAYVDIACEDISMGQSVVDVADFYKRRKNVFVLDKVNSKEFMVSFLNKIFPSHKEDIENILNNPKYGI
ncbi:nucleoside hydrolase [Clostridium perfringens]|uniref:nucleoside hydrolase n=1 Tax=Clostridium perfringens TaxID=1502 RepID=UPI000D8B0B63|nr:nucleoside hydrolase [Clostridium perfringens]MBP2861910.1 nucleoside hydrolase [Clostridium perfringens]MDG6878564.1 Pyrimidine-specific ribonucleoside hydrolase RihB [Clostridium perfringens]MDG6883252.1 Pyrimidine-specific ribonucleoside hydrolase RihB [Clostridium perfringens]MDH5060226.1 Pyrimidine-specific ribonucleoside hydrolase RihB [Clostridium perfringens NCTC 8239]CAG9349706.1 nucleoside hydrolase, IUNH family [Clostridium perfringens NCTC 8239]